MILGALAAAMAGDLNVVTPPDAEVYVDRAIVAPRQDGSHVAHRLQPGMHEIEIRVGRRMVDNLWVEVPGDALVRVEWAPGPTGAVFSVFAPTGGDALARPHHPERPDRPPPGPRPMDPPDFDAFLRSVRESSFDTSRMGLIQTAIAHNHFLAEQVAALLRPFDFDSKRAEVACLLAPRTLDPQNAHVIAGAFDFDSHRSEALACFR
ncbi:MAG: DUF4476 domain-containing protein [Myxococcales bacterium]|nr:DUF4476 domain-containing protein [Myxococcales bacterium]MCB9691802.1 DUF4476 domain-containing protein [Alphaproteobacteria bacterium]